ncbi:leucyl aminopeptidase family protein [Labedaea rhizosphaerae]|uniref:Probable cytosol aminopeptidase n=1 Tax=Labedaea rhizosphaerae TaxID=598644 RepID=A0A4R6SG66_LABRH|nr:leucyl aminopeptidase family protein [Labedaea rhizosphaerae]TDQ00527.1 leucyl aminopeptidase [Labedaea rhizosphaerae]
MRFEASPDEIVATAGDVLVLPVHPAEPLSPLPPVTAEIGAATGVDLRALVARRGLRRAGDHCWVPSAGGIACPDLLLVCVGGPDATDVTDVADLREAAMRCARLLDQPVVVCALDRVVTPGWDPTRVVVEAMAIGLYRFDRYRSADTGPGVERVVLPGSDPDVVHTAAVIGAATNFARDLTNTPAADLTPAAFAGICAEKASELGLGYRELGVAELEEGGFGGILGVGAGSANPPVLVCLESGDPAAPATALVGKGITFDSGGLTLKGSLDAIVTMKDDMGGAAAVLAALTAVRALGVDTHLRVYLPCAENALGPRSQRPGDVLRHRGGRTCEVVNPDAEGRLVLADALAYAREATPARIVDVATLTGSTGLGPDIWGIMGSSQSLVDALLRAGTATGDPGWQLPLWEGYRKNLRSEVADLRNHQADMSKFWNHKAIWAGLYLSEFVADTPWAHLDIAATVFRNRADDVWAAGATGTATRALIEFLRTERV